MRTDGYIEISNYNASPDHLGKYIAEERIGAFIGIYTSPADLNTIYNAEFFPFLHCSGLDWKKKISDETMGLHISSDLDFSKIRNITRVAYEAYDEDLSAVMIDLEYKEGNLYPGEFIEEMGKLSNLFANMNLIMKIQNLDELPTKARSNIPNTLEAYKSMYYLMTGEVDSVITRFSDDTRILMGGNPPHGNISEMERQLLELAYGDSLGNKPPLEINLDFVYENLLIAVNRGE